MADWHDHDPEKLRQLLRAARADARDRICYLYRQLLEAIRDYRARWEGITRSPDPFLVDSIAQVYSLQQFSEILASLSDQ